MSISIATCYSCHGYLTIQFFEQTEYSGAYMKVTCGDKNDLKLHVYIHTKNGWKEETQKRMIERMID